MRRTGVFATTEEVDRLKAPRPYIVMGGIEPESALQACHRMALAHGLPECRGYYGIDLRTGEFLGGDES